MPWANERSSLQRSLPAAADLVFGKHPLSPAEREPAQVSSWAKRHQRRRNSAYRAALIWNACDACVTRATVAAIRRPGLEDRGTWLVTAVASASAQATARWTEALHASPKRVEALPRVTSTSLSVLAGRVVRGGCPAGT
jgi:hypothetical protein